MAEAVTAIPDAELLILPGGLRVRDPYTGKSVVPGCCAGLEAWRDWTDVLEHREPWLGHDPGPWVEFREGALRVWQDGPHQPEAAGTGPAVADLVAATDRGFTISKRLAVRSPR